MRSLISTRAQADTCRRCRADVLRAVSEGLPATVDAKPIEPESEWRILLDGRRTYTLDYWHNELVERDHWRIRKRLGFRATIHAQHICIKPHEQLALPLDPAA